MATDDLDRLARVIRNLYTAMFERGTKRHNTKFRYTFSPRTSSRLAIATGYGGFIPQLLKDHPDYLLTNPNPGSTTLLPGYPFASMDMTSEANSFTDYVQRYWGWQVGFPPGNDFTVVWSMNLTGDGTADGNEITMLRLKVIYDTTTDKWRVDFTNNNSQAVLFSQDMRGEHFWALVHDSSAGEVRLYQDGTLVETETITPFVSDALSGGYTNSSCLIVDSLAFPADPLVTDGILEFGFVAYYSTNLPAHRLTTMYEAWQAIETSRGSAGIFTQPPTDRSYTALAGSGTGEGSSASAFVFTSGRSVTGPVAYADETQMWGVFRFRPYWAFGSPPTTPTVFRWTDDANNQIKLHFTGGNWQIDRKSAGAGSPATVAGSHGQYDDITVAFAITATQVKVSLNGGAFTAVGNTSIPTLSATTFNIGSGDSHLDARMHWAILGTGVITDSDVAALHAYGNADPALDDIPNIVDADPSLLWHCLRAASGFGIVDSKLVRDHELISSIGLGTYV